MRIGILGGTFDPVHKGHVYLAKKVFSNLRLDKIIFIPSYLPPHKKGVKVTSAKHRFNMLKLAIFGNKNFKVSDMEIRRKGRSYSVETLRRLRKKYGSRAELFFITGSDSLRELDKWKNLEEIMTLCRFVIVERPGFESSKPIDGIMFLKINARNISATDIRNRIKSGKALNSFLSGSVKSYISKYKLYSALTVFLFFMFNNIAYSGQNETMSAIVRSQEMIENEGSIREKINKNEKIYLKKVIITGAALIDKEKTKEALKPLKNHWISKDDIQMVMDSILTLYREKGYSEKIEKISYEIKKNILNIIVKEKNN